MKSSFCRTTATSLMMIAVAFSSFAQISSSKPALNYSSYRTWTTISDGTISNDGNFVFLKVDNEPVGGSTLIIKSTNLKWEIRSTAYINPTFTDDSKYLFAMKGDTLVQLTLKTNEFKNISNCKSYQLFSDDKESWLIFLTNNSVSQLVLKNLHTGKTLSYPNVQQYSLNVAGSCVVTYMKTNSNGDWLLRWVDYKSGLANKIYNGPIPQNLIFNHRGDGLAFKTELNKTTLLNYYHKKFTNTQLLATDTSAGIKSGYRIETNHTWKFSANDASLFFTQQKSGNEGEVETGPDIWDYKDAILRSEYNIQYKIKQNGPVKNSVSKIKGRNLSMVSIHEKKVKQLLQGTQKPILTYEHENDDFLLAESAFGDPVESFWNAYSKVEYYLCSTKTGKMIPVKPNNAKAIRALELSPDNRYLVYYDPVLKNFVSYNVLTKVEKIVSNHINETFSQYSSYNRGINNELVNNVAAWLPKTNQIILQGTYNLWLVDLENKSLPINLTKPEKQNNIIIYSLGEFPDKHQITVDEILIGGFNIKTKQYGIYNYSFSNMKLKELFVANNWGYPYSRINYGVLMQAKNSKDFLLKLESASLSPNYYYTKNFKAIIPLTNNFPEKKYNWIRSELIQYKDSLGNKYEGVLYTPENLTSNHKYPVIFNYYLEQSEKVNSYIHPEPSGDGINIPYLVSNGYLVFIPSIYQSNGKPGIITLNTLNAAADYLIAKKLIDPSKIGISGHSFGGFETNFVIAHSSRFKAAFSMAGTSNLIQNYNNLWLKGDSKQSYVSGFLGEGMEVNPEKYIQNSPILRANKIKTPLLLVHNENDTSVPVDQSIQMFVQLRTLHKPAWLLQYRNEGHVVRDQINKLDLQEKVKGFFDYYLIGKEIPKWMDNPITPESIFK